MNRLKKRQLERENKKNKKKDTEDVLYKICKKYSVSMKEFHSQGKGTLFDWMQTLEFEEIEDLQISHNKSSGKDAAILYLAMVAYTLSTGSDEFIDENPDTEESDSLKAVNYFSLLATQATLTKFGFVKFKFKDSDFFNYKSDGCYVKVTPREQIPEEYLHLYDDAAALHQQNDSNLTKEKISD